MSKKNTRTQLRRVKEKKKVLFVLLRTCAKYFFVALRDIQSRGGYDEIFKG